MSSSDSKAILVVGPSWIGDMVMAQCLFGALKRRYADTPIDVLAPEWVRGVIARMPEVRASIAAPFAHGEFAGLGRLRLGRSLRGRYSQAYVLPGSWKSALAPFLAGVPRRCGYLREARWGLLNDIRKLPAGLAPKTAMAFQALADPAVIDDASRLIPPKLAFDPANRTRLLDAHGLRQGAFVVLAPGAEYGPAKRWPSRHWARLAETLAARGLRPVLLGSAKDRQALEDWVPARSGALDLLGETQLVDAIDLMSAARFVVTNDSGLMHIAAATQVPVIAIYGSTSAEHTPPLSANARIVSLGLACSPCRKRTCPLGHLDCLETLSPERVLAEIDALA